MGMLKNKVVLLTGGTEGIGFECAKVFESAGAKISIISDSERSIEQASRHLNSSNVHYIKADVANSNEVEHAVYETLVKFGQINVVHNNAGISTPSKSLHETSNEEWNRLFEVNVKGIYHTTKFALEELKKNKGNILNTSSLVGEIGQEIHAVYSATKGAINALTKSMALDYAPSGIRVNAVAPAGVWTPMLRSWSNQQPEPALIADYLDQIHALGYCPEGDVIADACLFMISDMARFITGCILPVTGGAELGYRQYLNNTFSSLERR